MKKTKQPPMTKAEQKARDKAWLKEYHAKHPEVKFVSRKFPPTETTYQETVFEHRNGARIRYVRGIMPLGQEDILEVGWCFYCAGVISRANNANCIYMASRPDIYELGSYHVKPCANCAPREQKVKALLKSIRELNAEILAIEAEIKAIPLSQASPHHQRQPKGKTP